MSLAEMNTGRLVLNTDIRSALACLFFFLPLCVATWNFDSPIASGEPATTMGGQGR